MGDREKASLFDSNSIPKSGWSYMVPPSPPTPDCWHSENWMTPWTYPHSLRLSPGKPYRPQHPPPPGPSAPPVHLQPLGRLR